MTGDQFSYTEKERLLYLIAEELKLPFYTREPQLEESTHSRGFYFAQCKAGDFTLKALANSRGTFTSHLEVFFQGEFVFKLLPDTRFGSSLSNFREPKPQHHSLFAKLLKACELLYQEQHSLDYLIQNFALAVDYPPLQTAEILFKPSLSKNPETISCNLTLPNGESLVLQKNAHTGNYNRKPSSEWSQAFAPTFEYPVSMKDKNRMDLFNTEIDELMNQLEIFKEVNKKHRTCEILIKNRVIQTVKIKNEIYFEKLPNSSPK